MVTNPCVLFRMVKKEEETTRCTTARAYFWNEKLSRNQISESEGLCVIIIRRRYTRLHRCPCQACYRSYDTSCSTVIPFDLSRLLNKDSSLFSTLLSLLFNLPLQISYKCLIESFLSFSPNIITFLNDNLHT